MIAKYPRLGVLLFFCFVLCSFLFWTKSTTLQTVAQEGALETLGTLGWPVEWDNIYLLLCVPFFIIVRGSHKELH